MSYTVRPSTIWDVYYLAPRLRDADRREVEAAGSGPFKALYEGLTSGDQCYTVLLGPDRVGMFGSVRHGNAACIWAMGTDLVTRHPAVLMRVWQEYKDRLVDGAEVVGNRVHEDNEVHVRWLERLGFSIGAADKGFRLFTKETSSV